MTALDGNGPAPWDKLLWDELLPLVEDYFRSGAAKEDREAAMFRVYFFDQQMAIVEVADRRGSSKPHRWAAAYMKSHGWYTYAIGEIR